MINVPWLAHFRCEGCFLALAAQRGERAGPRLERGGPAPGCLSGLRFCPAVLSVALHLLLSPNCRPRLLLSPPSRDSRPGVSLSLLPSPLRPAAYTLHPHPARPASNPNEATSLLNPKSCQLNRSLRLRRRLLT